MSMTLVLWKSPVVTDPDEARALVDRFYSTEDESLFEASDGVVRFYRD